MKKNLTKIENKIYHYKDGVRMEGVHKDITGDVSGIIGNLDDCEITQEERAKGVDISELVK